VPATAVRYWRSPSGLSRPTGSGSTAAVPPTRGETTLAGGAGLRWTLVYPSSSTPDWVADLVLHRANPPLLSSTISVLWRFAADSLLCWEGRSAPGNAQPRMPVGSRSSSPPPTRAASGL